MIKIFIQWLFAREFAQARAEILAPAQALLADAKKLPRKEYIKYDRMDLDGGEFLFGIQTVVDHRCTIAWLNARRDQYTELVKYGTPANRDNNLGRVMAMDELFKDLEIFKAKYLQALEEAANGQREILV